MIHASRLPGPVRHPLLHPDEFFEDAEHGKLPTYSFIEPCLMHAHNDNHPAVNAVFPGVSADPPSSMLGGEELLARIYTAVRASSTADGSNFSNTLFLVTFDEHGGTYDHVPPPARPAARPGRPGRSDGLPVRPLRHPHPHPRRLRLDRPAAPSSTSEYRNTSLIRTLRERWLTRAAADRPRRHRPRHRARPHPRHPPSAGGLARGHAPAGAPDGRTRSSPWTSRSRRWASTCSASAIALDTNYTGHTPDLDPKTATGQQADDYMIDRTARIWPGLVTHPS